MKAKYIFFALSLLLLPFSCRQIEEPDYRTLEYSLNVTNDDYTATTVLDGIGDTKITEVLNMPGWVTEVTREEELLDGSMVLCVTVKADPTLEGVRTAQLEVKMSSGATAKLTVNQRSGLPTGLNAGKSPSVNTKFEEEWWSAQYVTLVTDVYTENGKEKIFTKDIPLPWNTTSTGVHDNLPAGEIEKMMKNKNDWKLAFNTTGIQAAECVHQNYFGLYNSQQGVLRVFYYWPEELLDLAGANDHMWYVQFQGSQAQHNATQFAVPLHHKLDINDKDNAKFLQRAGLYMTSAYTDKLGENMVVVPALGWWAFDIDISASRGQSFFDNYKPITIGLNLFDSQNIILNSVLSGSLDGSFDGKMNLDDLVPASANDWGKCSGAVGSGLSSFFTNKFLLEQAGNGKWSWGFLAVGCIANLGGNLGKEYFKSKDISDSLGVINADIHLDLHATMTTRGLIKSQRSHAVPSVTIPKEYFKIEGTKADAGDQMGKGLWNISEDPVVYIVKDAFWANKPQVTYYSRSDLDWYRSGQKMAEYDISMSPHQLGLRLISFFDPTSIGPLVINEDLFGHPEECYLNVSYGIYPGSQAGYTDWFREATSLEFSPITLSTSAKDQKVSTGNVAGAVKAPFRVFKQPYNKDFFKVLVENPYPESLGIRLSEQDVTGSKTVKKATTAYSYVRRYYGSSLFYCNPEAGSATVDEVQYVADPQIFLPYDEDRRVITDPDIPDMVVSVRVEFKSQGPGESNATWKTYTLRFIPKVQLIGVNEVKGIADKINSAANGGQPAWVSYDTFSTHNGIIQKFSKEISSQMAK